ncbi:hypothetical protein HDU85_004027 [Gaertneriomyces sp. JEL0708]|nr:hypothetical protein HDU85_004027 [Gaertneriomyces sp. JEL0708]
MVSLSIPRVLPSLSDLRHLPKYITVPVLVLFTSTLLHQAISAVRFHKGPTRGEYITVPDSKIRIVKTGKWPVDGKDPVVVFVAGLGSGAAWFGPAQRKLLRKMPELATLAYDRSGLGWSLLTTSAGKAKRRDLNALADELRSILTVCGLTEQPMILVGHSWGGPIIENYWHRYPTKNVQGLVMIDPTPARLILSLPPLHRVFQTTARTLTYLSVSAFLGLNRFLLAPLILVTSINHRRMGRELSREDRRDLLLGITQRQNNMVAAQETQTLLSSCSALEDLRSQPPLYRTSYVVVIHASESNLGKVDTGLELGEYERRTKMEHEAVGRMYYKGEDGEEWHGLWIDEGADHVDVVVGDCVVGAVIGGVAHYRKQRQ